MLLRKFSIAAAATLFIPLAGQVTHAATFTTQEVNEVIIFKRNMRTLIKLVIVPQIFMLKSQI